MSETKVPENPKYRAIIYFVQEDEDGPVFVGVSYEPSNTVFESLEDVPVAFYFAHTAYELVHDYMNAAETDGEVLVTGNTPVTH